jgi:DNA-binding transcriptional MerR regulator
MSEQPPTDENRSTTIVRVNVEKKVYSLDTAADLAGVHPDLVLHYHELGLLNLPPTSSTNELTFDDDALYELRRIEHYRRNLGVNRQALPLVVGLLREVEHLEAELRFLRGP